MSQPLFITIDHRERGSSYISFLSSHPDVSVSFMHLKIGDIQTHTLTIERKSYTDLLLSLRDGRLFGQLRELKHSTQRHLLLIEGREPIPDKLKGVLTRITAGWQIPVILAKDPKESAEMLLLVAKQESCGVAGPPKARPRRSSYKNLSNSHKMLMQIPSFGFTKADLLLREFSSLKNIALVTEESLIKVKGIGKKHALLLRRTFDEEFPH